MQYICPKQCIHTQPFDTQVEGMPEEVIFDHLHSTAFQWTPLGRTILGSADNVRRITRQNLLDYVSTHYTADRMVRGGRGTWWMVGGEWGGWWVVMVQTWCGHVRATLHFCFVCCTYGGCFVRYTHNSPYAA